MSRVIWRAHWRGWRRACSNAARTSPNLACRGWRIPWARQGLIGAPKGSTRRDIIIPREANNMRRVHLAVLAPLSVLAASPALAQAPQVEKNVSMAMALAILQGTIEQCTKDGYKVS